MRTEIRWNGACLGASFGCSASSVLHQSGCQEDRSTASGNSWRPLRASAAGVADLWRSVSLAFWVTSPSLVPHFEGAHRGEAARPVLGVWFDPLRCFHVAGLALTTRDTSGCSERIAGLSAPRPRQASSLRHLAPTCSVSSRRICRRLLRCHAGSAACSSDAAHRSHSWLVNKVHSDIAGSSTGDRILSF